MKTILTVDLDIVMSDIMQEYDKYSGCVGEGMWVSELEKTYPKLSELEVKLEYFDRITNYLISLGLDKSKFHFVENHMDAVNYVPKDEDYILVNLDYHGDLVSGDFGVNEPTFMNNGNWVYYLFKNGYLKQYTQICGGDVILEFTDYSPLYPYLKGYECHLGGLDRYDLEALRPDEVILCASKPWLPERYWYLFDKWKELFE